MNNEDISGIYLIKNIQTGKLYIGESKHIYARWKQHKEQLYQGTHYNKALQADYDSCGEANFEFILYQKINDYSGSKTTLKAKLLILEHSYIDHFKNKKHCELYNIRDSVTDILMDTGYYMSGPDNESYLVKLKERILAVLRSHIFIIRDKRYELEKKTKLSDLFSKEGIRYKCNLQKFLDLIPEEEFSQILATRTIEFARNGEHIIEHTYIAKDEQKVIEYLRNNFKSRLDNNTITITNMYKRLKMLNIITNRTCSRKGYYNILIRYNIITMYGGRPEPTQWALNENLIVNSYRNVTFTKKGIEYIEKIFAYLFANATSSCLVIQ